MYEEAGPKAYSGAVPNVVENQVLPLVKRRLGRGGREHEFGLQGLFQQGEMPVVLDAAELSFHCPECGRAPAQLLVAGPPVGDAMGPRLQPRLIPLSIRFVVLKLTPNSGNTSSRWSVAFPPAPSARLAAADSFTRRSSWYSRSSARLASVEEHPNSRRRLTGPLGAAPSASD